MKRALLVVTLAVILTTSSIATALTSSQQASGNEDRPTILSGNKQKF